MEDDTDVFASDSGITGELDAMCSIDEIRLRTETRQVDKFEISREYLKKYQRSSADKKYLPCEIRTISACWKSVEYLLDQVLDFDVNPKPGFSEPCYTANYFDIYSFLRDRLRAVRVDLHVQNAATDPVFIQVHEYCLRFELLSLYLLWGRDFGGSSDRKFDLHMTLTALSQTIDPLTNAYTKRRSLRTLTDSELETEAEITRYILLLSLTSRAGSKQFKAHFLKQPVEIQSHPAVADAFNICCEFYAGMNSSILARVDEGMDFLSTCAILPVVNVLRTRVLWRIVRTNRPFFFRPSGTGPPMPPPRPEKLVLDFSLLRNLAFVDISECAEFLYFNGLDTASMKGVCLLPPRQLSKNPIKWWLSSKEWRVRSGDNREFPDFEWNHDLLEKFETRIGTDLGDTTAPDRSEYGKKIEGVLVKKYLSVSKQKSRKGIVTASSVHGHISPIAPPVAEPRKLVSYPTFAPIEINSLPQSVVPDSSRISHPFGAVSVPPPEPKPDRSMIAIQPLSALIPSKSASPKKITQDHQKRPRDVVSPTPPSPNEPVVVRPKMDNQEPQSSVVPFVPIPSLPEIQSSFDILANELESLRISNIFPELSKKTQIAGNDEMLHAPSTIHAKLIEADLAESANHMRALEIAEKRTKFIALKSLIAWRQVVNESRKWKQLLASQNPVRL